MEKIIVDGYELGGVPKREAEDAARDAGNAARMAAREEEAASNVKKSTEMSRDKLEDLVLEIFGGARGGDETIDAFTPEEYVGFVVASILHSNATQKRLEKGEKRRHPISLVELLGVVRSLSRGGDL